MGSTLLWTVVCVRDDSESSLVMQRVESNKDSRGYIAKTAVCRIYVNMLWTFSKSNIEY
jgi:hypothetical protein